MGDDPVRRRIREAMQASSLTAKALSLRMGRNETYMQQYFRYRKPAQLDFKDALKLKSMLNIDLAELGFPGADRIAPSPSATAMGLAADVVVQIPGEGDFLASSRPDLTFYDVKSPVLDRYKRSINTGDVVLVDSSDKVLREIADGDAVVVDLFDKESMHARTSVLRQFVAPALLITNSSGPGSILNMDDADLPFEPIIKGKVVRIIRGS